VLTNVPRALLHIPPHAKLSRRNVAKLQAQCHEFPGFNHADLWGVMSCQSHVWIYRDFPFCRSPRICLLHSKLPWTMPLRISQSVNLSWCSFPFFLLLPFSCRCSLVSSPVPYHPPPPNYISTTDHSFSINRYFVFTYTFFETTPLKMGLWNKSSAGGEFSLVF
jgi:hypothetical protein